MVMLERKVFKFIALIVAVFAFYATTILATVYDRQHKGAPASSSSSLHQKSSPSSQQRVVCIGNINGDKLKFDRVLRSAGIIDELGRWIAVDTSLIFMGNIAASTSSLPIRDWQETIIIFRRLRTLKSDASMYNSELHFIIGKNEVEMLRIADKHINQNDASVISQVPDSKKIQLIDILREFSNPRGRIFQFLKTESRLQITKFNTLFSHGGLASDLKTQTSSYIKEDDFLDLIKSDTAFLSTSKLSPILYDEYSTNSNDGTICFQQLKMVLKQWNVKRMIVGANHNVMDRKFAQRCDEKLIFVDAGTDSSGGFISITGNLVQAFYINPRSTEAVLEPLVDFQHPSNYPANSGDKTSLSDRNLDKSKRLVAVGDIHGDFLNTRRILQEMKLIDGKDDHWIGGNAILVFMGGVCDIGDETIFVFLLVNKLKKQAEESGGEIHFLIGQPELENLANNYEKVSKNDIELFHGVVNRKRIFSAGKWIGKFLREETQLLYISHDTVFVSAGLTIPASEQGEQSINRVARAALLAGDWAAPVFEKTYHAQSFYSNFFQRNPKLQQTVCRQLDQILMYLKVQRMVVSGAHLKSGKIEYQCDGKLINIDIGISKHFGSHCGAIEFRQGQINEFYCNPVRGDRSFRNTKMEAKSDGLVIQSSTAAAAAASQPEISVASSSPSQPRPTVSARPRWADVVEDSDDEDLWG